MTEAESKMEIIKIVVTACIEVANIRLKKVRTFCDKKDHLEYVYSANIGDEIRKLFTEVSAGLPAPSSQSHDASKQETQPPK